MPAKTEQDLATRLQERALAQAAPIRGRTTRAAFVALRPDIELALQAGHRMVAIWELLHEEGKFPATYSTFRRYCAEAGISAAPLRKAASANSRSGPGELPLRRFAHDPTPNARHLY